MKRKNREALSTSGIRRLSLSQQPGQDASESPLAYAMRRDAELYLSSRVDEKIRRAIDKTLRFLRLT